MRFWRSGQFLGSVFGRTDFSRIFIFGPPDCFADFLAGFFLLIFVGKSAQKNPPGKSPAKSSKIYTTKIPDTFLQRVRPNNLSPIPVMRPVLVLLHFPCFQRSSALWVSCNIDSERSDFFVKAPDLSQPLSGISLYWENLKGGSQRGA